MALLHVSVLYMSVSNRLTVPSLPPYETAPLWHWGDGLGAGEAAPGSSGSSHVKDAA